MICGLPVSSMLSFNVERVAHFLRGQKCSLKQNCINRNINKTVAFYLKSSVGSSVVENYESTACNNHSKNENK